MKKAGVVVIFLVILVIGVYGSGNSINTKAVFKLAKSFEVKEAGRYKIASFNIQTFGQTKINKTIVKDYLPKIVRNYDIVVIQELRDSSNFTISELVNLLPEYNILVSPRLGRSNSKEQYVVIYKNSEVFGSEVYPDDSDVFEREPYSFYVKIGDYDFSLITIHIKPTDAENEIRYLKLVIDYFTHHNKDKDFILLGDFNADCGYYNENKKVLSQYEWVISNDQDTTVASSSCTYDRIITNLDYSTGGVFRFDEAFGLEYESAKLISDHYPVWISFS